MEQAVDFFLSGLWNLGRRLLLMLTLPAKIVAILFALIGLRAGYHGDILFFLFCIVVAALIYAIRDWIRNSRWN